MFRTPGGCSRVLLVLWGWGWWWSQSLWAVPQKSDPSGDLDKSAGLFMPGEHSGGQEQLPLIHTFGGTEGLPARPTPLRASLSVSLPG